MLGYRDAVYLPLCTNITNSNTVVDAAPLSVVSINSNFVRSAITVIHLPLPSEHFVYSRLLPVLVTPSGRVMPTEGYPGIPTLRAVPLSDS